MVAWHHTWVYEWMDRWMDGCKCKPQLRWQYYSLECVCVCVCVCVLSHSVMSNSATLWTAACWALPSKGFSRREYWSGLPCPPPGDLPNSGTEASSGTEPSSLTSVCIGRQALYHERHLGSPLQS